MWVTSTPRDSTRSAARSASARLSRSGASSAAAASPAIASSVSGSTISPRWSDLVRGTEMPSSATTYAPCHVNVCTSCRRAWRPPDVPGTQESDGLPIEVTRADEPVERVLRDSREAAGVLGRRHDHDIGLADTASPLGHRRDGLVLAGEVERGDVGERIELFDSRAVVEGDRSYDIECSTVRGATLEASADEQHTNHDSPNPARAARHSVRAWEPRHSGRTRRQVRP